MDWAKNVYLRLKKEHIQRIWIHIFPCYWDDMLRSAEQAFTNIRCWKYALY